MKLMTNLQDCEIPMLFKISRKTIAEIKADAIVCAQADKHNFTNPYAEHILYTPNPGTKECYQSCLAEAVGLQYKSIAFPLFDNDSDLAVAMEVFNAFWCEHQLQVILAVPDKKQLVVASDIRDDIAAFLQENYEKPERDTGMACYRPKESGGRGKGPQRAKLTRGQTWI